MHFGLAKSFLHKIKTYVSTIAPTPAAPELLLVRAARRRQDRLAAPATVRRFVDEVGSHGVAFHITDPIERRSILLDGKNFEPPLVNMPVAGGVAVGVKEKVRVPFSPRLRPLLQAPVVATQGATPFAPGGGGSLMPRRLAYRAARGFDCGEVKK